MRIPSLPVLAMGLGLAASAPASGQEPPAVRVAAVDEIFERFDGTRNPGCAVGVSHDHHILLERAYGMADLEHDVPNTATTVFEPGSVSKQFTAGATLLLVVRGEISLDDDVRDYIPELPEYDTPVTVRHLIHHTSGLRDWGSIAGIHGWQRTTRVHTHEHVLDIASRQTALNYPPGEYYSYTNTGYNLQAVLVERVTGMTLDEFSRENLFGPIGMTRTQWRDDFTEVVKDRSIAYAPSGEGGFSMLMPFENVHGNGGLLTTVGDLLRWTHNLETGEIGGPAWLAEMHRQGVLASGKRIAYAGGLFIGEYRGVREIQHAGGTAAYGGYLTRYPDQGVAVAVMCNAGGAGAGGLAHEVADLYLAGSIDESVPSGMSAAPIEIEDEARLEALAGGYRDAFTGAHMRLTWADEALRISGAPLRPVSPTRFEAAGMAFEFDGAPSGGGRPGFSLVMQTLDEGRFEPVDDFEPGDLSGYAGDYWAADAETRYTIELEDGGLVVKERYGSPRSLTPAYEDAFNMAGLGATLIFSRDGSGRIDGFSWKRFLGRVWDLRFERQP